jgi:hypothetical protein
MISLLISVAAELARRGAARSPLLRSVTPRPPLPPTPTILDTRWGRRARPCCHGVAAVVGVAAEAQKARGIFLTRALTNGEVLAVVVELAGFDVGAVAPIAWRPSYVRFVVPVRAHGDVALGVHRPIVTVRRAGGSGEELARFDFDLEVPRADGGRSGRSRCSWAAARWRR